jgi:predicted ATPase
MTGQVSGREAELAAVDGVLDAAREGMSCLLSEGEAGIGKTAVWRAAVRAAEGRGYRVLACRTAQTEARLSFTALGDLFATVDASVTEALPGPQRRALDGPWALALAGRGSGSQRIAKASNAGISKALAALLCGAGRLSATDDLVAVGGMVTHNKVNPPILLCGRYHYVRPTTDRS